ncbi:HEAT repeat domain-containing protein [Roseobacter sinensis]|uniref:HEAT repeat domain-containing protein n=1 Tax=Roseobacter sinensis TaxID=2931391 RepID=A0ABT3BKY6_9RHOB|nr:HEAT repeat domain-containing protein [Roseobacter sp. WL0113]MCV3274233.1 HEAT repeat domain-containing protein [Roseobacter sp. WL0113]
MATHSKPSNDLRKLIASGVIRAHPSRASVRGADLDVLKSILSGATQPGFAVNRKRALEVLARSEASAEVTRLLGMALSDRDADVALRTTAARLLRLMPPRDAEKVLIPALTTKEARLRRALYRSLGEIGGKAAQKALEDAPPSAEASAAKLLVSLRGGALKGDLSSALDLVRLLVEAEPLPKAEAAAVLKAIGGAAYGVPLRTEQAVCFDCRTDRQAVFLAKETDLKRSGIVGAVVQYRGAPSEAELRYVVLYSKTKARAEIALMTPAGRVDYAGVGTVTRGGMAFDLRDADGRAVPLIAEARVSDRMFKLSLTISERGPARRAPARRPQSILAAGL